MITIKIISHLFIYYYGNFYARILINNYITNKLKNYY